MEWGLICFSLGSLIGFLHLWPLEKMRKNIMHLFQGAEKKADFLPFTGLRTAMLLPHQLPLYIVRVL